MQNTVKIAAILGAKNITAYDSALTFSIGVLSFMLKDHGISKGWVLTLGDRVIWTAPAGMTPENATAFAVQAAR